MYIFQPDRFLLQKEVAKVAHYLKGKTLDVGSGEFARYDTLFAKASFVKMDVKSGPNVDVVGSADKIPFPEKEFDSILCTQVFEHLREPFVAAKELSRVIKNGGYAIVTVPQVNELHEEPHDYFRYTKFGLAHLFESNGFEVVECLQRGGYYTMMAQLRTRYYIDRWNLYSRPVIGRVISIFLKARSRFAMALDKMDRTDANLKHTIGWTIVLKKI